MTKTVLVIGASGLIGAAVVEAFLREDWRTIAISRRKPEIGLTRDFEHLPVDLSNKEQCVKAIADLKTITHVVYAAVHELPGLIAGWQAEEQMQTNLSMLMNIMDPLSAQGSLRHITLLQGTKAYGVHLHRIRIPAREREPRDKHKNFYWLQEDYIKKLANERKFDWTIFRPTVVIGPTIGVAMNVLSALAVYGTLCRVESRPFCYTGNIPYVREAADVRLIADAAVWAAEHRSAASEHYNITNGEVFSWHDLWPVLAERLRVTVGPDSPCSLAEWLPTQEDKWSEIVHRYGLRNLTIANILGQSGYYADFGLGYGLKEAPPPMFVSSVKIKQAGFRDVCDTEKAVLHWLDVMINRKIIPDPGVIR